MKYDAETGEVFDEPCIDCGKPLDGEGPRCRACWEASRVCPCGASIANTPVRTKRCAKCRDEAEAVKQDRAEARAKDIANLRATDPACEVPGDPPVVWKAPVRMGGDPTSVLLRLPRLSGRGLPGSHLTLAARYYDGCGPNGGEARHYVTAFTTFADAAGYKHRSIGVAVRREELRAVAAAFIAEADRLDAEEVAP